MDEAHNIGVSLCLREVLKRMRRQTPRPLQIAGRPARSDPRHMSRGSIVIVTSLAAEKPSVGVGGYVAAKHAAKGLVETAGKCHESCAAHRFRGQNLIDNVLYCSAGECPKSDPHQCSCTIVCRCSHNNNIDE